MFEISDNEDAVQLISSTKKTYEGTFKMKPPTCIVANAITIPQKSKAR